MSYYYQNTYTYTSQVYSYSYSTYEPAAPIYYSTEPSYNSTSSYNNVDSYSQSQPYCDYIFASNSYFYHDMAGNLYYHDRGDNYKYDGCTFTFIGNDYCFGATQPVNNIDCNPILSANKNDAPVATDDFKEGTRKQDGSLDSVTLMVTDNDSDVDGDIDITSIALVGANNGESLVVDGEGVWTVSDTGSITFTPDADFDDVPTAIEYTVKDDDGLSSNTASVTINYPVKDLAPTAFSDKVEAEIETFYDPDIDTFDSRLKEATISVTANDTDDKGLDTYTVSIVGADDNGELVIKNEGTWHVSDTGDIIFTPMEYFFSNPTPISYTVKDTNGVESNPASVEVVYPNLDSVPKVQMTLNSSDPSLNFAPSAFADKFEAEVETFYDPDLDAFDSRLKEAKIAVTANDVDDKGIDASTVAIVGADENGELVVHNQGTWHVSDAGEIIFTPVEYYFDNPAPISYTVQDANGVESVPASVQVVYPNLNNVPKVEMVFVDRVVQNNKSTLTADDISVADVIDTNEGVGALVFDRSLTDTNAALSAKSVNTIADTTIEPLTNDVFVNEVIL